MSIGTPIGFGIGLPYGPYYSGIGRNLNTFAFMGDSRQAAVVVDISTVGRRTSANHFFNQANATPEMASRMSIGLVNAVAGNRSDQYASQTKVSEVINSNCGWVIIWGVVNDIAQGFTASQAWNGYNSQIGLLSAANQLIKAGIRVVFVTETGANNYGTDAAKLGEVAKYNRYLREYCQETGGAYMFDIVPHLLDPVASQPTYKTGYSQDGTHPQLLGSYNAGLAFATMMLPLVPASATQLNVSYETFANGGVDLLANSLFTTTTGGAGGTGFTGSIPASWYTARGGTPTCTVSTASNADGFGNDLVLTCAFTNSTDFIIIRQDITLANAPIGTILQAGVDVTVDSGSSNFAGCDIQVSSTIDSVSQFANSMYRQNMGSGPTTSYRQIQKSKEFTFTGTSATTLNFSIRVTPQDVYPNGTIGAQVASGTVRVRRPWLRICNP